MLEVVRGPWTDYEVLPGVMDPQARTATVRATYTDTVYGSASVTSRTLVRAEET